MQEPNEALENAFQLAKTHLEDSFIKHENIQNNIRYVVRCNTKSGVRALLACALAKVVNPKLDIRKPYTEIKDKDSYSGRVYDETYVADFVSKYSLPANQTTAWLTPAFRTNKTTLTPGVDLGGTPAKLYDTVILLLNDVHTQKISAFCLLKETIRQMLILRYEREDRLSEMIEELGQSEEVIPLSSEEIVMLIEQHLNSPKSSRLPVLVITAAYEAAKDNLGESVKDLYSHNAPDNQTGAIGDVEITIQNSDGVVTAYEMKGKEVKKGDINIAVKKITSFEGQIDNYIFITTEGFEDDLKEYADSYYRKLGGVEIAILDCIGFLRHFLHLFHRLRSDFLDSYQNLLLHEPESSVSQPLKEIFLSLRKAAEEDELN